MRRKMKEGHSEESSGSDEQKQKSPKKRGPLYVPTWQVSSKKVKPKSKEIIINLSMTRYEIIADVAEELGWDVQYSNKRGDWDVFWTDHMIEADTVMRMHFFQKISHFPGISMLARKNLLGNGLTIMGKRFPKSYNFFPRTWLLPNDYPEFRQIVEKDKQAYLERRNQQRKRREQAESLKQQCENFERNSSKQSENGEETKETSKNNQQNPNLRKVSEDYQPEQIVKPQADCQGKGIFLTFNTQQVENGRHYVVQEYVERPFLVEGLKFDLRIYVLICGTNPLRLYCYEEGLARLATEKYAHPNNKNLKNFYMHLTNYAVNKKNPKYVYNSSAQNMETGHKRSITSIFKYIKRRGHDVDKLKSKIYDVIVKTLILGEPLMSHQYKFAQPDDQDRNMCFHIVGLDIMLAYRPKEKEGSSETLEDSNIGIQNEQELEITPIVLQVNHTPSFTTDTPLDHHIKSKLIRDTLILLNINSNTKKALYRKANEQKKQKKVIATNAKNILLLESEENQERIRLAQQRRDEYEQGANLGGYIKIYPCEDEKKMEEYDQFMKYSGQKVCFTENNVIRGQMQQIKAQRQKQKQKEREKQREKQKQKERQRQKEKEKEKYQKEKQCQIEQELKIKFQKQNVKKQMKENSSKAHCQSLKEIVIEEKGEKSEVETRGLLPTEIFQHSEREISVEYQPIQIKHRHEEQENLGTQNYGEKNMEEIVKEEEEKQQRFKRKTFSTQLKNREEIEIQSEEGEGSMEENIINSNNMISVLKNSKDYHQMRNVGLFRQNKSNRSSKYEPNTPQRINSFKECHRELYNNHGQIKKQIRIVSKHKIPTNSNSFNHHRPPVDVHTETVVRGVNEKKLVTITTPNSNNPRNSNSSLNNKGANYSLLTIVNKQIKNIIQSNKIMKNTINNILNHKNNVSEREKMITNSELMSPTLTLGSQKRSGMKNLPTIEPIIVARSATIEIQKKKFSQVKKVIKTNNTKVENAEESEKKQKKGASEVACCGINEGNGKKGMIIVGGTCKHGSYRNSNKHFGMDLKDVRKGVNFIGEAEEEWSRKRAQRK